VLVGAVLLFGAFSLASAYSTNVDQLLVLRFLTGLGWAPACPTPPRCSRNTPRSAEILAGDQHVLRLQPRHGRGRFHFR
jgi:MFS family permease